MAIIIAARPDPFMERMKVRTQQNQRLISVGYPRDFSHVRRPLRGIVPKGDTYATLDVYDATGRAIPLLDSGARSNLDQLKAVNTEHTIGTIGDVFELEDIIPGVSKDKATDFQAIKSAHHSQFADSYERQLKKMRADTKSDMTSDVSKTAAAARNEMWSMFLAGKGASLRYSNFLISQVQEARQEKYQIMETFGIPYIFFFGERPRIYNFSGVLLNSLDFQWRTEFWANYDNVLRGTRLVEMGARAVLTWDDIIAEGYILNASAQDDSQQPNLVQFAFSMFITNYQTMANLGDVRFPTPAAVSIDTAFWKDDYGMAKEANVPYTSNVDQMRRKNLEAAAQKKSPGLLGYLAMGLAYAHTVATVATNGLENFVKQYETVVAGRDVRFPVGAFPLLDEIQSRPDLQQLLRGTNPYDTPAQIAQQIAAGISPETRRLIQIGGDDPAGLPTFFVQDKDLIINLTNRYNERAVRKIKVLPPGGVFMPPLQGVKQFGGLIRDNLDEYIQQSLTPVVEATKVAKYGDEGFINEEAWLTDVIANMITKFRAMGVPMTDTDETTKTVMRPVASTALRLGMSAGTFSYMAAKQPSKPDSSTVDDIVEVVSAQAGFRIRSNKQAPSTQPKADLSGRPIGQPEEILVVTPTGIKKRPKVIRPTTSTSINDPKQDQEALARILKQARKRNARRTG